MKFHAGKLYGVWIIDLERLEDERGFFARTFCAEQFAARGLNTSWPQCNLTRTERRGIIRGLHYQAEPKPETKLIRCSAGIIFDVVADVRPTSPTFGQWEAFELAAETGRQIFVPAGFAHGFQCLTEGCEVLYQMSEFYHPELGRGVCWNDPSLKIPWPISPAELSERDRNLPLLLARA